jgi:hypothetical protein
MGKKPSFWVLNVIRLLSMAGTVLVAYGEGRRFAEAVRLITTKTFGRDGNICGFLEYVYVLPPLTSIPIFPRGSRTSVTGQIIDFSHFLCLVPISSADPSPCT